MWLWCEQLVLVWFAVSFFQRFDCFSIQINQLEADLQELGSLVEKAERKRVQELLKQEQKKVEKELAVKRQQKIDQARREADPSTASKAPYTVKITNYGMVPKHNTWCAFSRKYISTLFTLLHPFHSLGPVREVCQNIPHVDGCAQNSIRKCGGQLHRWVSLWYCLLCLSSLYLQLQFGFIM